MPSQSRRGQNKAHGTDGWNIAYARPTEDARVWQVGQRQTRTPACPRAIAARALCSRARRTRAPFALPALLHCRGACAWLAARSAATCIKTSTRPTVTPITLLYFLGHLLPFYVTVLPQRHLIKVPFAAKILDETIALVKIMCYNVSNKNAVCGKNIRWRMIWKSEETNTLSV